MSSSTAAVGSLPSTSLRLLLLGPDHGTGRAVLTAWFGETGQWTWGTWVRVSLVLALAGGLGGGSIAILVAGQGHSAQIGTALGLLQCLPFLLVVRSPLAAWRLMTLGMALTSVASVGHHLAWPWPPTSCVLYGILLLLLSATYPREQVGAITAVSAVAIAVPGVLVPIPWLLGLVVAASLGTIALLGDLLVGRAVAERRLVEAAEQRRQDRSHHLVLEERNRIARELHDVVAHHMAGIALQAEAAPLRTPGLPQPTLDTLVMIRDSAREALTETRRVVGLLREPDGELEREPQPGLARLPELVEHSRASGVSVALTTRRDDQAPTELPIGTDVSAYRIVQEALSNAVRHAPGSEVTVRLRYGVSHLDLDVTNTATPGSGGSAQDLATRVAVSEPDTGHGLVGMRERVDMLGGTLATGPWEGGGFRVHAVLPLDAAP